MRHPHGHLAVVAEDGRVASERDVVLCAHCQRIMTVGAGTTSFGWCGRCAAPVCPRCDADGRCTPFERRLEAAEARDRICRAAGIGLR